MSLPRMVTPVEPVLVSSLISERVGDFRAAEDVDEGAEDIELVLVQGELKSVPLPLGPFDGSSSLSEEEREQGLEPLSAPSEEDPSLERGRPPLRAAYAEAPSTDPTPSPQVPLLQIDAGDSDAPSLPSLVTSRVRRNQGRKERRVKASESRSGSSASSSSSRAPTPAPAANQSSKASTPASATTTGSPSNLTDAERQYLRVSKKARKVQAEVDSSDLSHSSLGFIGTAAAPAPSRRKKTTKSSAASTSTRTPNPSGPDGPDGPTSHPDPRAERLRELIEQGYRVVEASDSPTIFPDTEGRIPSWTAGFPGKDPAAWLRTSAGVQEATDRLRSELGRGDRKRRRKSKSPGWAGTQRGNFAAAHFGYSYGGGQKRPSPFQQSERKRAAWRTFLRDPDVCRALKFISHTFKTWAPEVWKLYDSAHDEIQAAADILLDILSDDLPYAAMTANFGPQTACWKHRDLKNLAYGLCAIYVLGSFDHKRGGHLVLHELKLIVELRPGDVIFLPSAVVTHENIPVAEGEIRQSLVFYSAGGLFRWLAAGRRTYKDWKKSNPEEFEAHQAKGEERWRTGWNLFRTVGDISTAPHVEAPE